MYKTNRYIYVLDLETVQKTLLVRILTSNGIQTVQNKCLPICETMTKIDIINNKRCNKS